MRRHTRRATITAAAAALLAVTGTAMAAFTTAGVGTGTGTADTMQPPTVTGTLSSGLTLHPGAVRSMKVVVTNPNSFSIQVTRITRSASPVVVDGPHAAGCTITGVELTSTLFNVFWTVPAAATRTFTLTNGMRMTNASQTGCQNATFTVPLGVTAVAQ